MLINPNDPVSVGIHRGRRAGKEAFVLIPETRRAEAGKQADQANGDNDPHITTGHAIFLFGGHDFP